MLAAVPHRHLDARALAKVANLKLRVRRVVDGVMAGLHRAPHRGASIEFAEHKEYSPGDDLRRLDWKALGKFDRYYIRQYEDETELKAYLLLDCSGSMGYGAPLSKLEYGAVLVGSLAYLLGRQRDRPGLLAFADGVRSYVPPRPRLSQLAALLRVLEGLAPGGGTSFERAFHRLAEVIGRRSLVALVSDMFDTTDAGLHLLRRLRARGHQVLLLHLLHEEELTFPFSQVMRFEAMESDRRLLVDPPGVRQAYLRQMERFCNELQHQCRDAEVGYRRVSSAEGLDAVLLSLLSR